MSWNEYIFFRRFYIFLKNSTDIRNLLLQGKLSCSLKDTDQCVGGIWATTWQNQQNEYGPSEDSDQPGHSPSLIRAFAVRMKKAWVFSYPLSAQWRLWSDWADAQANLSLRWVHSHFVGFDMSRLIWGSTKKIFLCLESVITAPFACYDQVSQCFRSCVSFFLIISRKRYKNVILKFHLCEKKNEIERKFWWKRQLESIKYY